MNNRDFSNPHSLTKDRILRVEKDKILREVKEVFHTLRVTKKRYMDNFKLHHKIIFAFLVFFGINLVWYGMWEIISYLPLLRNPIVAILVGAFILITTGYFYENLISTNFHIKPRKKRSPKPLEIKIEPHQVQDKDN